MSVSPVGGNGSMFPDWTEIAKTRDANLIQKASLPGTSPAQPAGAGVAAQKAVHGHHHHHHGGAKPVDPAATAAAAADSPANPAKSSIDLIA